MECFYIQSNFDWICWDRTEGVFVCVCACVFVSVCVSVCVCHLYSLNRWFNFDETFHKWSLGYLRGPYFSDFEISKSMTSWRQFCNFSMRHSHGRIFCSIFFKFCHKVPRCLPVFAIENQQNRSVTSANMADRVFVKNPKWPPKIKFSKSGKWGVNFY